MNGARVTAINNFKAKRLRCHLHRLGYVWRHFRLAASLALCRLASACTWLEPGIDTCKSRDLYKQSECNTRPGFPRNLAKARSSGIARERAVAQAARWHQASIRGIQQLVATFAGPCRKYIPVPIHTCVIDATQQDHGEWSAKTDDVANKSRAVMAKVHQARKTMLIQSCHELRMRTSCT